MFVLRCLRFAVSLHAKIRKMVETFFISVLIIAISIALLGIRVVMRKKDGFRSYHIDDSKYLKERKIHCVLKQDKEERSLRKQAGMAKSKDKNIK